MAPLETLTCIVETPKDGRNEYEFDGTLARSDSIAFSLRHLCNRQITA
jgi:hypothetical protein